jgi:hypothetical protein
MTRVTFYVQVVPEWAEGRNVNGSLNLFGAHADRMTRQEPLRPLPGAVVVPVTLDLPDDLFGATDPLLASVTADSAGGVRLVPSE